MSGVKAVTARFSETKLYMGFDNECILFESNDNMVTTTSIHDLDCDHKEADTRIIWHLSFIVRTSKSSPNISVRATDTDVFIILLHHVSKKAINLWMDVGLSKNNTRAFINISKLAMDLGKDLCNAIVSFHAFTGCDYTASFMRKGKIRPYKLMEQSASAIEAFANLGEAENIEADTIEKIEQFVCSMYAKPRLTSVNDVRLALFNQNMLHRTHLNPWRRSRVLMLVVSQAQEYVYFLV